MPSSLNVTVPNGVDRVTRVVCVLILHTCVYFSLFSLMDAWGFAFLGSLLVT